MEIKGLVFDLDGIITNTAPLHFAAWKQLAKGIGIELPDSFEVNLKGVSRIDSLKRILEYGNKQNTFNQEKFKELTTKKNDEYVKALDSLTKDDILPGINKLFNDAKNMGLKMSIASASFNAPVILKKLGIIDKFDFIVNPGDLSAGKPDPEIFVRGAKGIGLKPEECIGFEDAIAGVRAINAANMYSVGVGNEDELSEAKYIVNNTSEINLEVILKSIN